MILVKYNLLYDVYRNLKYRLKDTQDKPMREQINAIASHHKPCPSYREELQEISLNNRISEILSEEEPLSTHQLGPRERHSTTQQFNSQKSSIEVKFLPTQYKFPIPYQQIQSRVLRGIVLGLLLLLQLQHPHNRKHFNSHIWRRTTFFSSNQVPTKPLDSSNSI